MSWLVVLPNCLRRWLWHHTPQHTLNNRSKQRVFLHDTLGCAFKQSTNLNHKEPIMTRHLLYLVYRSTQCKKTTFNIDVQPGVCVPQECSNRFQEVVGTSDLYAKLICLSWSLYYHYFDIFTRAFYNLTLGRTCFRHLVSLVALLTNNIYYY